MEIIILDLSSWKDDSEYGSDERWFMSFYRDHVYPQLVGMLGDPPPIKKVRQQIIPLAEGNVLEIGARAFSAILKGGDLCQLAA